MSAGTCIETYTGKFFDYADPQPEQVCLTDIARALSNTARFGGHTELYYSVAEHSVLVHDLVAASGANAEVCMAALLHDAHEAYLGDIPTPLKRANPSFNYFAVLADDVIAEKFGFPPVLFNEVTVKEMDTLAMRHEAGELKVSAGVGPHWGFDEVLRRPGMLRCYTPPAAEARFKLAFKAAEARR